MLVPEAFKNKFLLLKTNIPQHTCYAKVFGGNEKAIPEMTFKATPVLTKSFSVNSILQHRSYFNIFFTGMEGRKY